MNANYQKNIIPNDALKDPRPPSYPLPGHSNHPSPVSADSPPNMIGATPTFMIQSLSLSPRHRIIQIGRPLMVNPSSLSPVPRLILISTPQLIHALAVRHTHQPRFDISSSINLLPRHPPTPHSSLTFLRLLIHSIHYSRPCASKASPHHKSQYILRPQRPTTPVSICPSSIQPRTTRPKTNTSTRLNRLNKSPV